MFLMNNFSEFLYNKRKKLGLTQQDIADELGISNKAVSKWEAGDSFPETAQLVPLANVLGCSVDELLRGAENDRKAVAEETRNADPVEKTEEPVRSPMKVWQIVLFSVGIFLTLAGVAAMLIVGFLGEKTKQAWTLGTACMFALIAVGAFLSAYAIIRHAVYDRVSDDKKGRASLAAIFSAVGMSLICFSIAALMFLLQLEVNKYVSSAVMIVVMALGVSLMIVSGLIMPSTDGKKDGSVAGIVFPVATIVFLVCGFFFNLWHPMWIVFPAGGVVCGIIEYFRGKK